MAKRGSTKDLSIVHEEWIAKLYGGKRSKSSGAADNDQGDVRCERSLIECKMTKKKPPKWVRDDFTKITYEAFSEGREPVLAFRFYEPGNVIADRDGYIDLVVRKADDDAQREEQHA